MDTPPARYSDDMKVDRKDWKQLFCRQNFFWRGRQIFFQGGLLG